MNRKLLCKLFLVCIGLVFAYADLRASFLDYDTNNSAEFFRNPAGRTSAVDSADIACTNPAGTIRMGEGFFVNFSNQMVIKTYAVEDKKTGDDYKTKEPDLIVPNLYIVWNPKDSDFNLWSHIGIIGGGGTLYYADGAPVVNRVLAAGMAGVDAKIAEMCKYSDSDKTPFSGLTANNFSLPDGVVDAYNVTSSTYHFSVLQRSYQFCEALGTTYALNSNMSFAIGLRVVESYKANQIFYSVGVQAAQKCIDVKMRANGVQGILGVNYRPINELNLALTYETFNRMKYKVKVKSNGTDPWGALSQGLTDELGMEDGKTFRYDMPHRFSAGATYNITPDFDVTFDGRLYITKGLGCKIETGTNDSETPKYLNSYAYELGIGFDWKVAKEVVWSAGFVWINRNQNNEYMNEVLYHPNVYVLNTGFMFKVNDRLNINIGFGRNFLPDTDNDRTKAYNPEPGIAEPALAGDLGELNRALGGKEIARDLTFKKETWVTAVGAQYNFL